MEFGQAPLLNSIGARTSKRAVVAPKISRYWDESNRRPGEGGGGGGDSRGSSADDDAGDGNEDNNEEENETVLVVVLAVKQFITGRFLT